MEEEPKDNSESLKRKRIFRREFLKTVGLVGLVTAFTCYISYKDNPGAVKQQVEKKHKPKFNLEDIDINQQTYRILGVKHTRDFAEAHYNILEQLVTDCSFLISEGNPELQNNWLTTTTFRSYHATLFEFCHKHKKPIIYLDPRSFLARNVEGALGSTGFVYAYSVYKSKKKQNRFLKFGKISLGSYFLYNFLISPIVNTNLSKIGISPIANDFLSYNHNIDQRNIGIAERLLELSELLLQKDFEKGKYALVEFGRVHFPGVIYYLSNSNVRKIKSVSYVPTYNLLDSNEISRFDPTSDGWQKTVITK